MKLSARNQLKGTIKNISEGAVNGVVTICLGNNKIKADITMDAIRELGLSEGQQAYAVIKASSVMFATSPISGLSARNQLSGTVTQIQEGAVNGRVTIELSDGTSITGSITNEAISELGLTQGGEATAIIKSTDVMVGI